MCATLKQGPSVCGACMPHSASAVMIIMFLNHYYHRRLSRRGARPYGCRVCLCVSDVEGALTWHTCVRRLLPSFANVLEHLPYTQDTHFTHTCMHTTCARNPQQTHVASGLTRVHVIHMIQNTQGLGFARFWGGTMLASKARRFHHVGLL